jgi:hypothetical protein
MDQRQKVTWSCSCDGSPEFGPSDFIKHARDVHHIPEGTKGTGQALMHGDGRDFFVWIYAWTFEGFEALTFIQTVEQKRR